MKTPFPTIVALAEELAAEFVAHYEGPWRPFLVNDDVPEFDYHYMLMMFPDATSEEINNACRVYRFAANSAFIPPLLERNTLAQHVLAMADDTYLQGHPEWASIVDDAEKVLGMTAQQYRDHQREGHFILTRDI